MLALPCLAFYFETDREETDVRHIDGIIYYNFDAICSSAERLINIRLGTLSQTTLIDELLNCLSFQTHY